MVNLELYRIFYTVAKTGSLTKAAEELYISQPAASQAVKQLETQLGGKLFNRTHSGMILTEVGGRQVFAIVQKALKLLESAELKYAELKTTATGVVKICASDTAMTRFLLKHIKTYHERYPNVNLVLEDGTTTEIIAKIIEKKADIGFVNLPVDETGVEIYDRVLPLHDIFVGGPRFKNLSGNIMSLAMLPDYPLLMLEPMTSTRQAIINFSHSLNIHLHPEIECATIDMMIEFAKAGVGLACVPREYVEDELAKGELFEIRTEPTLPMRTMGMIIARNETQTFAVKEFLAMME